MTNLIDLKGRTVLITGAGGGVGRGIALTAAAVSAGLIVVNDYHADRAESVAEEIKARGGRAVAAGCDVTDFNAVARMIHEVSVHGPPISVLVNNAGNAGATGDGSEPAFWDCTPGDWQRWIDINLIGVMNCSRHVLGAMVKQQWGRIITIISDAGRVGEPQTIAYSAAKAGAAGFSRALAKAVGRHGVTVNCVSLGAIRTAATEALLSDPEMVKRVLRSYPTKRLGEPDDVAAMVAFLASDASGWITGQTYPVNGGYSFAM